MSERLEPQLGFTCPACGEQFRWKPELAGKSVICQCTALIQVPRAAGGAAKLATAAGAALSRVAKAAPRPPASARQSPPAKPTSPRAPATPSAPPEPLPVATKPASPSPPVARAKAEADGGYALADKVEQAAVEQDAEAAEGAGVRCPSCRAKLPGADAVLCTNCGTDLRTGEKVAVAAAGAEAAPGEVSPWAGSRGAAGAASAPPGLRGVKPRAPAADDDEDDDDDEPDASASGDLMAEDSPFRNLYLPLMLIAFGVALAAYQAYVLGEKEGGAVIKSFLPFFAIAAVVLEAVLIFAALCLAVKLFDMGLGPLGPALIKVMAIAIGPGALGAAVQEWAGGGIGAIILAGLVSILMYFGLIRLFFPNIELEKAIPLIVVVYLIENWAKRAILMGLITAGIAAVADPETSPKKFKRVKQTTTSTSAR